MAAASGQADTPRKRSNASRNARSKKMSYKEPDSDAELSNGDRADEDREWENDVHKNKRRKKSHGQTKRRSRTDGSLSALPELPLDVLFEIFSQLSPKDLLAVSRVSKIFRQTLNAPNASTIWKTSRRELGYDAPDPPEDFTETRWAKLLFDGTKCQECDVSGVHNINFQLRVRICNNCMKTHFVYAGHFGSKFPDYDKRVLDLIPYTSSGAWSGGSRRSKYYYSRDIHQMHERLDELKTQVSKRGSSMKKRFEDLKEERQKFITAVTEYAPICHDWQNRMAKEKQEESFDALSRRRTEIKERFKALGYKEEDMAKISWYSNAANRATDLSERGWKQIKGGLEADIMAEKTARLLRTSKATIDARTAILEAAYNEYRKTRSPSEWIALPALDVVKMLPCLHPIIFAEGEEEIGRAEIDAAMSALPKQIADWQARRLKDLVKSVNRPFSGGSLARALNPSDAAASSSSKTNLSSDVFDLAVCVFQCHCRSSHYSSVARAEHYFGLDGVMRHCCRPASPWSRHNAAFHPAQNIYVNKDAVDLVGTLLEAAERDRQRTTVEEMDKMDARFVCNTCPWEVKDGKRVKDVMTIRGCVDHAFSGRNGYNHRGSFRIVTKDEMQRVERVPGADGSAERSWSCNHCIEHLDDWKMIEEATEHVKTAHSIDEPEMGGDVILAPGKQMPVNSSERLIYVDFEPDSPHSKHSSVFYYD